MILKGIVFSYSFSIISLSVYRNATDLLYPATLLNSLISLRVSVWSHQGFLYKVSCHLHRVTLLPLPFQFGYLLFLLFVWLLWLGLPILCWVTVVRVGMLVLFQILVGRFQLSSIEYYIDCEFAINGFYYAKVYIPYTHFGKSFYHEWMLDFVKCFFSIYWDDHVVVDFFVNVCLFVYVELSLWTWDKSHLVVVYDLFYMLLDLVG